MMWHSFLDGRLGLVKVMIMMWTPCMLREFNLVGCSYIVIIDNICWVNKLQLGN
jgi:hypothetical protein